MNVASFTARIFFVHVFIGSDFGVHRRMCNFGPAFTVKDYHGPGKGPGRGEGREPGETPGEACGQTLERFWLGAMHTVSQQVSILGQDYAIKIVENL